MTAQLDTGSYPFPHPALTQAAAPLLATRPEAPRRLFDARLDAPEPAPRALADVWDGLMQGELRVHGTFRTPERLGLRLAKTSQPCALPVRTRRLMENALTASAQKVVGLDEGLAASTVAMILHHGFKTVGLSCIPSRVPFLVAAAAAASVSSLPIPGLERRTERLGDACYVIVTLHHPSYWLRTRLSPGEAHVAALRSEGLSHAEIAELRESSRRTVANQLANAYQKLNVSGRLELMSLLVAEYQRGPASTPRPAGQLE
jgi:DNA-binding CsgD family transcriptional regulator